MSPIPNLMIPFLVLLLIIWGEHFLMDLDLLGWLLINELGIIVPSEISSHIVLGISRGHCAPCRGRWLVDWSSHRVSNYSIMGP